MRCSSVWPGASDRGASGESLARSCPPCSGTFYSLPHLVEQLTSSAPRRNVKARVATLAVLAVSCALALAGAAAAQRASGAFMRRLGEHAWQLSVCFQLVALIAAGLFLERLRDRASSAPAAVYRLVLYAFAALTLAQAFLVDAYDGDLAWVIAAAASSVFPLALLVEPLVRRACRQKWIRGPLRGLDVLCLSFLLALGVAELGLRAWRALSPSPLLLTADLTTRQRMEMNAWKPGSLRMGFTVNSGGHYDTEFLPRAERDGRHLVVTVGDSFSASVVPHYWHFTTVCERLLEGVEVYNFGIAACGPHDYLEWVRRDVRDLQPDAIVVNLFLGNDLQDANSPEDVVARRPWLHHTNLLVWLLPTRIVKLRQARLSPAQKERRMERRGVAMTPPEELVQQIPWLFDPTLEPGIFSEEKFLEIERQRARYNSNSKIQRFEVLFGLIRQMREAAGKTPFGVMLIPDEYQVEDGLWQAILDAEGRPKWERQRPSRVIRTWLQQERIPHVDLLPRLRALPVDERGKRNAYLLRDTHFNVLGNQVAAEGLAELVRELRQGGADTGR